MKKKNVIFLISSVLILLILVLISSKSNGAIDPETYQPAVYSTIGALIPPVAAIILALVTKEVYSSLFVGIFAGALLYANGNLELMLNTMFYNEEGGMIFKLADSWNVGILVFLVILGIMVALMNRLEALPHSDSGHLIILNPAGEHSLQQWHLVYLSL